MLRYVTWYVPGAVLCPGKGYLWSGGHCDVGQHDENGPDFLWM